MNKAEDKLREVAAHACDAMRETLKQVLSETIGEHYSERDWNNIILNTQQGMFERLTRSYPLSQTLCKSDLYNPEGRVNLEAVIEAFNQTKQRVASPAHQAQLTHLIDYLTHTFQGLKSALRRAS